MKFTGKVWRFPANINTDLILPMKVYYEEPVVQARHVFGANRPGWVDEIAPGDIIIAERNFGMGSSRPAARSLKLLGLGCLLADSINGLFYRNCINFGFPALECPGVSEMFCEGDTAEADFDTGRVTNLSSNTATDAVAVPDSLRRVLEMGGIYPLLEAEGKIAPLG